MGCEGLEKIEFEEVGKDRTRSHGSLGKKDPIILTLFLERYRSRKTYQGDLW